MKSAAIKEINTENSDLISSTYNIEIEQHILGHIITNNSAVNTVIEILKPDCFYHSLHQKIFEIIVEFSEKRSSNNTVNCQKLYCYKQSKNSDEIIDYINKLIVNSSFILNLNEYSRLFKI